MLDHLPVWTWAFLMSGILLVLIAVPARVLWSATRRLREEGEKLDGLVLRLREHFQGVQIHRSVLHDPEIHFTDHGRKVRLRIQDSRLDLGIEEKTAAPVPVVLRTPRAFRWGPVRCGWEVLDRVPTGDPMLDGRIEVYASSSMAGFLRDRFLDEAGEPSAGPYGESLVLLSRLPGVRSLEARFLPGRGVAVRLKTKTEDLLYRADEIEALLHHVHRFHHRLVNYDRDAGRDDDAEA